MIQRIRDYMAKQHRIDDIEDTVYVRNLQENGRDCGVFLLQHINAVSLGLAVEDVVKQEHMPDWRRVVARHHEGRVRAMQRWQLIIKKYSYISGSPIFSPFSSS